MKKLLLFTFIIFLLFGCTNDEIPESENEPPLTEKASTAAVPDFLNDEQIDLYRRFLSIRTAYGSSSEHIDYFPRKDGYEHISGVAFPSALLDNGEREWYYHPAQGRYERWEDYESMGLSVLTEEYFKELTGARFININGKLYFAETNLGGPSFELKSEAFELVTSDDNIIEFNIIATYYELSSTETFERKYTIKMKSTENGWRISLFDNIFELL